MRPYSTPTASNEKLRTRPREIPLDTNYRSRKAILAFSHLLRRELYAESIKALKLADIDILVCFDSALTDETKLRLADRCLLKTI